MIWKEGKRYQSIDWGGSSLEWEVLTVSTQPGGEAMLVFVQFR